MSTDNSKYPTWNRIASDLARHFAFYVVVAATLAVLIKIRHG